MHGTFKVATALCRSVCGLRAVVQYSILKWISWTRYCVVNQFDKWNQRSYRKRNGGFSFRLKICGWGTSLLYICYLLIFLLSWHLYSRWVFSWCNFQLVRFFPHKMINKGFLMSTDNLVGSCMAYYYTEHDFENNDFQSHPIIIILILAGCHDPEIKPLHCICPLSRFVVREQSWEGFNHWWEDITQPKGRVGLYQAGLVPGCLHVTHPW